jgi:hypothetical protein
MVTEIVTNSEGGYMASGRTRGRALWDGSQDGADPAVELLIAMVKRARKDVEEVQRKGERATPGQIAERQSAEQFLNECREAFT